MNVYFGIDFGTTNTVVSIAGKGEKVIDSFSVPTILFIPFNDKGIDKVYIGKEAVRMYREDGQGRYLHSIKRSLIDTSFSHTTINKVKVTLEDIVLLFINELKTMIYDRWGIEPDKVALGRPVKFSEIDEENDLANRRLLKAFKLGGVDPIQLEEPIAAAYGIDSDNSVGSNRVLIADIGGGTSDFTSIEIDNTRKGIDRFSVINIDGVDIGGDNFDESIMYREITPYLGINETYRSFNKRLELPIHLFTDICKWNLIYRYDTVKFKEEIRDYLFGSSNPDAIKRLSRVYMNRLSSAVLDRVKEAKHTLTDSNKALINLKDIDLDITHRVDREVLPSIFEKSLSKVRRVFEDIQSRDSNKYKIFVTGGSSKLPQIRELIMKESRGSRVEFDSNYYSSISNGLALFCKYSYEDKPS